MRSLNMLLILVVLVGCGVVNVFPLAWGQDTDSDFTPPPGEPLINIVLTTIFWGLISFIIIYIIYLIHLSISKEPVRKKPVTGIKLLRALAWMWLILCPLGGIVFWVELEKVLVFDGSMLGFELFLAATLSGVVTFAVFLVLCTIAENLIAIKNAVTSNTQQSS